MKFGTLFLFSCVAVAAYLDAAQAAATIAVEEGIVCPADQPDSAFVVQLPSLSSCTYFYKCNRGVAHVNKCPDGLHYNTRLQACDFPLRAKCTLGDKV